MDTAKFLAENERLIADAEDALSLAVRLAVLTSSRNCRSSLGRTVLVMSKLLDDFIELRGRLLLQQTYQRDELKRRE